MKLAQLWLAVAQQAQLPGRDDLVERVVRALAPTIVQVTSRGDRVSVPGLGVFRGRPHKGRDLHLPQGGHHVIEPRTVLTFRAAESVRILRRSP